MSAALILTGGRGRSALIERAGARVPLASLTPDGWLHTGTITPHRLDDGCLVSTFADLPGAAVRDLRRGVFRDICGERVRVQAWQAATNLQALLAMSSPAASAVRLRVYLRSIVDAQFALETLGQVLGPKLPSIQVVEGAHAAVDSQLAVWIDAVGYAGQVTPVRVPMLDAFTAPFPAGTIAGGILMTSMFPGMDPQSMRPPRSQLDLDDQSRALISALAPVCPRSMDFLCQQAQMARNLQLVFKEADVPLEGCVHLHYWSGVSMRQMGNATLTRAMDRVFGDYAITSFPPSSLRFPGSLAEGSMTAATSMRSKAVRIPRDSLTGAYVAGAQAGSLLFTAGEVPLDRANGAIAFNDSLLPESLRGHSIGSLPNAAAGIKAAYIYTLLQSTLAAYGCSLQDVVRQDLFLADLQDAWLVEQVAASIYGGRLPPTCVTPILEASPHPLSRMEIELTCSVPNTRSS
jgi:enamine deaminase RidA (YjgF/YER057c/UK114 family)